MVSKKGQISLFVIIGIVVLILVGIVYFTSLNKVNKDINSKTQESSLSANSPKELVDSCLKEVTLKGIEIYGIQERGDLLDAYIAENIPLCTENFNSFKNEYTINEEKPEAKTSVSEESLTVSLTYKVLLEKPGKTVNLDSFSYTFDTSSIMRSRGGTIEKGEQLLSSDMKGILKFNENTKVTDASGKAIDSIALKVLDRNANGLSNGVVPTMVLYEGQPEGAIFSQPVELTLRLSEEDIKGVDTSALKLAYYDKTTGLWISVPDSSFDKENMTVTGFITHFSMYSVALCGGWGTGKYLIPMGFVVKDPFIDEETNVLADPLNWNYNIDPVSKKLDPNGIHIIPEKMQNTVCEIDSQYQVYMTPETGMKGKEMRNPQNCIISQNSEFIRDWDNDDDPNFDISGYKFDEESVYDTNGNKIDDVNKRNEIVEKFKEQCRDKCSIYAKQKIKDTFSWVTDEHISGDGIRDGTTIFCDFRFVDYTNLNLYEAANYVSCLTDKLENNNNAEYYNNLLHKNEIWSGIMSMEAYKVVGSDSNEEIKYYDIVHFFATPKTFGMVVSTDDSPTKRLLGKENAPLDEVFAQFEDYPYYGKGDFTFNILNGGDGCVDGQKTTLYGESTTEGFGLSSLVVTVNFISEETFAASLFDCVSDGEYYRECFNKIEEMEENGMLKTNRKCADTGKICYQQKKESSFVNRIEYEFGVWVSTLSNAQAKADETRKPLILPDYKVERTAKRYLEEGLSLLNYPRSKLEEIKTTGSQPLSNIQIERYYDWSCSDMCVWTLNEKTSTPEMGGQEVTGFRLQEGENIVTSRVFNVKDPILYARGYLKIEGAGVAGLDQCGASIQDRIQYLCDCTGMEKCTQKYASFDADKKRLFNCLALLRDKINSDEARKADNPDYYAHKISLCDARGLVEDYDIEQCAGVNFDNPIFGNGGMCLAGEKYCRDVLVPGYDDNCICGNDASGTPVVYDGQEESYCCFASAEITEQQQPNCRGSSGRRDCELPSKDVLPNNEYRIESDACYFCDNQRPVIKDMDACFPTQETTINTYDSLCQELITTSVDNKDKLICDYEPNTNSVVALWCNGEKALYEECGELGVSCSENHGKYTCCDDQKRGCITPPYIPPQTIFSDQNEKCGQVYSDYYICNQNAPNCCAAENSLSTVKTGECQADACGDKREISPGNNRCGVLENTVVTCQKDGEVCCGTGGQGKCMDKTICFSDGQPNKEITDANYGVCGYSDGKSISCPSSHKYCCTSKIGELGTCSSSACSSSNKFEISEGRSLQCGSEGGQCPTDKPYCCAEEGNTVGRCQASGCNSQGSIFTETLTEGLGGCGDFALELGVGHPEVIRCPNNKPFCCSERETKPGQCQSEACRLDTSINNDVSLAYASPISFGNCPELAADIIKFNSNIDPAKTRSCWCESKSKVLEYKGYDDFLLSHCLSVGESCGRAFTTYPPADIMPVGSSYVYYGENGVTFNCKCTGKDKSECKKIVSCGAKCDTDNCVCSCGSGTQYDIKIGETCNEELVCNQPCGSDNCLCTCDTDVDVPVSRGSTCHLELSYFDVCTEASCDCIDNGNRYKVSQGNTCYKQVVEGASCDLSSCKCLFNDGTNLLINNGDKCIKKLSCDDTCQSDTCLCTCGELTYETTSSLKKCIKPLTCGETNNQGSMWPCSCGTLKTTSAGEKCALDCNEVCSGDKCFCSCDGLTYQTNTFVKKCIKPLTCGDQNNNEYDYPCNCEDTLSYTPKEQLCLETLECGETCSSDFCRCSCNQQLTLTGPVFRECN